MLAPQVVQLTCKRFYRLLAEPLTNDAWGSITLVHQEVTGPGTVGRLSEWVQRRAAGESCTFHSPLPVTPSTGPFYADCNILLGLG